MSERDSSDAQTEVEARAPQARQADGERAAAPPPRLQEPHPDQEAPQAEATPAQGGAGVARGRTPPQAPADGVGSRAMPRVKSNVARLKRKNKVMKLAKGYFGGRSKLWKAAKESVERAAKYAYRDRRRKKGGFRRLWITRINAAARLHALSYSPMMNGLRPAGVEINRKLFAGLPVPDPAAFQQLAEVARQAL